MGPKQSVIEGRNERTPGLPSFVTALIVLFACTTHALVTPGVRWLCHAFQLPITRLIMRRFATKPLWRGLILLIATHMLLMRRLCAAVARWELSVTVASTRLVFRFLTSLITITRTIAAKSSA